MNFLVLMLVLLLEKNTHWRHAVQRDEPVRRALRRIAATLAGQPRRQLLLVLGVPLLVLGLLLWSLAPLAYGWLLLPVHLLVVLWSLGRGDTRRQLEPFRASWQRGDREAAYLDAQGDLGVQAEDDVALLAQVQGYLLWRLHQGFFAVIFWYALLGPLPALAYRLLVLVETQAGEERLAEQARQLRALLDWLPARALALSLALAGNFVAAYQVLRPRLTERRASAMPLVADVGRAAADLPAEGAGVESLDELWRLMQRATLIWYCAIALWVLLPL
ncbi:MAG TPA: regulatory signaling modulator protein AmpE [Pseudomonas sp.]|nr:regulatory signaling modulator protein AmpE [Pseudomonas sp.]